MLLEIDKAVFELAASGDDRATAAYELLILLTKGRHEWRPDALTAIAADRFRNEKMPKAGAMSELIYKCVEQAAEPSRPVRTVTVTAARLAEMVADLQQAAVLVLEDGLNEAPFVQALAAAFGHQRVVDAIDNGWIRMGHAGGGGRMHMFVAQERARFRVVVQVAAILDSDRKAPGDPAGYQKAFDTIAAMDGVSVHMWRWRESENYLPTSVWVRHCPTKGRAVERLKSMPPEQRGYIDTKPLLGKPKPLVPVGLRLTSEDFAELGPEAVEELRSVVAMIDAIL